MRRLLAHADRGSIWMIDLPSTRGERIRGLRDKPGLRPRYGMLFERCRSVHTFGMLFPIDVVLLDRSWRVMDVRRMPPRRVLIPRIGARHVLECAIDADLRPGDRLLVQGPGLAPPKGEAAPAALRPGRR